MHVDAAAGLSSADVECAAALLASQLRAGGAAQGAGRGPDARGGGVDEGPT